MELPELYFLKVLLLDNLKGPTISTIHKDVNNFSGFGEGFMNSTRQCYIFWICPNIYVRY